MSIKRPFIKCSSKFLWVSKSGLISGETGTKGLRYVTVKFLVLNKEPIFLKHYSQILLKSPKSFLGAFHLEPKEQFFYSENLRDGHRGPCLFSRSLLSFVFLSLLLFLLALFSSVSFSFSSS